MFKIPNWEDDVPKSNVEFGKSNKNKKEKKFEQPTKSLRKPNQQNDCEAMRSDKKFKKKYKKIKNLSPSFKPKENGVTNQANKKLQNKNNNKSKFQQNETSQHKQSPKTHVYIPQPNLNGKSKPSKDNVQPANKLNKKKRSRKRKQLNNQGSSFVNDVQTQDNLEDSIDISNPSKPKKMKHNIELDATSIVSAKKKKNGSEGDDSEVDVKPPLINKKKEKFRKMLQAESHRNSINISKNKLRERMMERLKAAQFRFLNEKLYTTSGSEAQQLFQTDPDAFHTYHQGYQQQLKKWPVNPLDLIVKRIAKMPKTHIIADMGCGEAALSKRVQQNVRSFDLVASAPGVEACDMAHSPLLSAAVDVAVYCLALMGTELTQYLVEANRVLKMGGHLLIAEVESRFEKVETFTEGVERLGFKLKNLDQSHQVFYFMEFTKVREPPAKKSKLPTLTLKPCLYKRR